MLERVFAKPATWDRIRAHWLGADVEAYIKDLLANRYAHRTVRNRIPLILALAEFALAHGVKELAGLPSVVDSFVKERIARSSRKKISRLIRLRREILSPVRRFIAYLRRVGRIAQLKQHTEADPFTSAAPGFFDFLRSVRGLKPHTVYVYRLRLGELETFLRQAKVARIRDLSPRHLSAFIIRTGRDYSKGAMMATCAALRAFLSFLYMRRVLPADLSREVQYPTSYRKSSLPRALTWDQVRHLLEAVDRRCSVGRRDYAILVMMITYGLRAAEVAGLRLGDIDWKRDRLHVNERKAGHNSVYPLSRQVGEAILDYLQHGRPQTESRYVFMSAFAPLQPATRVTVSHCAKRYLIKAGIRVHRPGSHTLRHTCAVRLLDQSFPLKEIGDYLAHRSAAATEVYAKVDVRNLREVAMGDGEEVL